MLDGWPTENYAADTKYFSASRSLVYTFLIIDPTSIQEDNEGKLLSCHLQCAPCQIQGSNKGLFEVSNQGDQGTGRYRKCFYSKTLPGHHQWYADIEAKDQSALGLDDNMVDNEAIMSLSVSWMMQALFVAKLTLTFRAMRLVVWQHSISV